MNMTHMWGFGGLWMVLVGAIVVVPFWKICSKAGFPGVLSLLILIPLVNLVFLYVLAFADWRTPRD